MYPWEKTKRPMTRKNSITGVTPEIYGNQLINAGKYFTLLDKITAQKVEF